MKGEVKKAVYKYLDQLKTTRTICGWELAGIIGERLHYRAYPTVILKAAKWWAFLSGGAFDCIDCKKSLYRFEPGRRKVYGTSWESVPVESKVKEYKRARGK